MYILRTYSFHVYRIFSIILQCLKLIEEGSLAGEAGSEDMHFEFYNRGGGVFFLGILYIVEPEQQPKKLKIKIKIKTNGYILFHLRCDPIFVIYIHRSRSERKERKKRSHNRSNLINHGFLTIRNKGSMRARLERPTR